jgi:hypothetical protein
MDVNMPKDGLPTGEDFVQAMQVIIILQNSILDVLKILKKTSDEPLQTEIAIRLMPATLAVIQFKSVFDKIDPRKLTPVKAELLQFADPPEPEVVQ